MEAVRFSLPYLIYFLTTKGDSDKHIHAHALTSMLIEFTFKFVLTYCVHVAVMESGPDKQKMEPVLQPLEEKPVKERVDDEGKEQPLTEQSPVSSSTPNQAKAVQLSPCKRVEL